jgi:hypothetical protein
MSIVGLPGLRGPYELRQGRLVPALWQDTVVHAVRQRPGEVDPHAAEGPLVERQVEARLRDCPGIERRRRVADPDLDPAVQPRQNDLDRASTTGVAVLDHVARQLVDRLDEVGDGLLVGPGVAGVRQTSARTSASCSVAASIVSVSGGPSIIAAGPPCLPVS